METFQKLKTEAEKIAGKLKAKVQKSGYVENLGASEERNFKSKTMDAMSDGKINYQEKIKLDNYLSDLIQSV